MQRCQYCGQLNGDFEEHCIYCGGLLYIKVDHEDDENHGMNNQDKNHMDAVEIAKELLNDEKRRQENYGNQHIDINQLNDIDSFAKELLSPENDTIDYIPDNENTDRYFFEDKSVGDDENAIFEEDDLDYPKRRSEKHHKSPEFTDDDRFLNNQKTPSFNNKPNYLNNNITYTKKVHPYKEEAEIIEKPNTNDYEEEIALEDEYKEKVPKTIPKKEHKTRQENKPIDKDKIINIENKLKKKIRRNKKLENSLGLTFQDIELNLKNINEPIMLNGKVSINKSLGEREGLQISVICYDHEKNEIGRSKTVFSIEKLFTYINFSVGFNTDVNSTAMLIILPEIVEYISEKTVVKPKKIRKNSKKPKKTIKREIKAIPRENSIFIEQMKDIEHKIGMDINNTSVITKSSDKLEIVGEIYIKKPEKYNNLKIAATCYNDDNKIIATQSTYINTKLYLGFDTLSVRIDDVDVKKVVRVRLYPTFQ